MSESFLTHMIRVNLENWEVRYARQRANSSGVPDHLRAPVEVGGREIRRYIHGHKSGQTYFAHEHHPRLHTMPDPEAGYNHHV